MTGGDTGIYAHNYVGSLTITATGNVEGTEHAGIRAENFGTDLTIRSQGDVSGGLYGIYANNVVGSGALTISAQTVEARAPNGTGIYAFNSDVGTNLTIAATSVSGAGTGIEAIQGGIGELSIATTGSVTGTTGDGINATTTYVSPNPPGTSLATNLSIDVVDVTGYGFGILANAYGSGSLSIKSTGTVKASKNEAIWARNSSLGTSLKIDAANVEGGWRGIYAKNSGTYLTIGAGNVSGYYRGIDARNYGSGALSITTTGAVSGGNNSGIYALNKSAEAASTTTVTIEDGSSVRGGVAGVTLATGTDRAASLANAGTISNLAATPTSLAISTTGGPTTITNNGLVLGTVESRWF